MSKKTPNKTFQSPKGTRDFYPEELLRRRYIAETWRAVSIRNGFEEIDGPTFEHADLYTVKSGEGILSELFSFRREGGDDLYALRPEFTPTLARMYAARARQLPSPTRWFCIPNFFRAENPQRGRLREFFQWNVDVLGGVNPLVADVEVLDCLISAVRACGLDGGSAQVKLYNREAAANWAVELGITPSLLPSFFRWLDRLPKMSKEAAIDDGRKLGLPDSVVIVKSGGGGANTSLDPHWIRAHLGSPLVRSEGLGLMLPISEKLSEIGLVSAHDQTDSSWCIFDSTVVRGLAYYTGTVFEVIAEGERAIAGGGRYDNLIELFGGPPTPACGFGMGDVVLSLVLEDRGLMPTGMAELRDAVECVTRSYSMRPDAFVFSNGDGAAEAKVVPLLAELRRGVEQKDWGGKPWRPERYEIRPMHARTTGKSTRNVGKLLKDAASSNARFAVILESGEHATVKDLTTGDEHKNTPIEKIARMIAGG